jgi:hypothetical protein
LFFVPALILVLCFAIWILWTEFAHPFLNGELLQDFAHKNGIRVQFRFIVMPLDFWVLFLMSSGIVYSLFFILKRLIPQTQWYMIFSKNGVDMAGWQCDWKVMVWFGGKKTMNGKGIMPCWVAKGIDEDYEFTWQILTIIVLPTKFALVR